MRRTGFFLAVLALAAVGAGAAFQAGPRTGHAGRHGHLKVFGIADPDLITEPATRQAAQLADMKAIGITSVRLDADWAAVQPVGPGTFDWGHLDQVVRSVLAAHLSVDLIIDGCPPWAAVAAGRDTPSPQPASAAQFAAWAGRVAARYTPEGVRIFEIWNEPNNKDAWQPAPNPAAYTADLVAAYSAIKRVDPSAFVLSGGLAPGLTHDGDLSPVDFLQAMYADGARGSFDGVGFHPYSYPALPDSYELWSGWSQLSQTHPSLRTVMARHGDAGKPIWITEYGAPSDGPYGVGNTAQAAAITQAIADVRKTSWIGAFYLYSWQDDGTDPAADEDWFGLFSASGARKPAYYAVKASIGSG